VSTKSFNSNLCLNVFSKNSLFVQAKTSFCWAFAISTMIRHSLKYFLAQLEKQQPSRFNKDTLLKATQYLNDENNDFHKRLRTGGYFPSLDIESRELVYAA